MENTTIVPLPINLEAKTSFLFLPFSQYSNPDLDVKYLKDVFITFSGLVLGRDGVFKESHHGHYEESFLKEALWYFEDACENPEKLIELNAKKDYLIIHHPWYNYYHWMCEAILRLWMIKDKLQDIILILPDYYGNTEYVMSSLEPFNIKNIFFIPDGKSLFASRLYLPRLKPNCESYDISKLREIRSFYINYAAKFKNLSLNKGERIYLSRKKANRKKVTNEIEVEDLMAKYGFVIIENEDYNLFEQISIYSNASYMVSIHGSGLTNMLFMKSNSKILEIHKNKTNSLNRPSFVFWYQAAALGFSYYHQSCSTDDNDDYFFGDFHVEIKLLEKNLQLMLR